MVAWNATTHGPTLGTVGTKAPASKAKGAARSARADRPASSLTPRQERFCQEYLVDLNGTQAAIRAGYSATGANVTGVRLLSNPTVAARIADGKERQAERLEVRADTVLRELLRIATADLSQAFDEGGNLLSIHQMPEDVRRAIASVKVRTDDDGSLVREVKLWDKPKSLELLGKHLRLFVDRVEHDVSESLGDLVLASMRAKK